MSNKSKTDIGVAAAGVLGILFLSLFLQKEFDLKQALLMLVGVALGISLMHALFGFSGGWRMMIRERRSVGVRAQLLLLAISSILFFPVLGHVFPEIKAAGAVGPVSVSVLVGAFFFGIGMQLGGGCGSGTLFTVGQGQTDMLITISFFIIGATLGSVHLPWWLSLPNAGKISLIESWGWLPSLLAQLIVFAILFAVVSKLELSRHAEKKPLFVQDSEKTFIERLVVGPWPLWYGAVALSVLGLATLLLAGHTWSITFAFGLWGTKIWSAMGGDISSWSYWNSGYPQTALNSSVLADTTSIVDIGIMLGAMLAAALAGKYAPANRINKKRVVTVVVGGLLLGYGARLAFGCNIGALLGGVASGSVHGWLWLVSGFVGSIVGVKARVWLGVDHKPT